MKILHVTPHLGGGVGKAHAALRNALPHEVEQTFVLLEAPRDPRYADALEASGARVVCAKSLDEVAALAGAADIVQFEFWNHPRLFECLAKCPFPAMRTVFWSHVSGLSRPVIPPGLIEQAGRFVFTTEASRSSRSVAAIPAVARGNIHVINSGFGFTGFPRPVRTQGSAPGIAYLGTVDFIKMHPGFFEAIDALAGEDIRVSIWGSVDPSGAVAERARTMRHPERIHFGGQIANPAVALSAAEMFFYPLQRDHYGTAENALVEAMSLGLVPVVLDNPAELAIVRHGETGLVARSIEQCTAQLQKLLSSPELRGKLSRGASRDAAETKTPARSAREFMGLWQALLGESARRCDFRQVIGETPAEWFLATQCLPGETWEAPRQSHSERPSKGMLAHFISAFPFDASLSRLADVA
jgi:glycosyltransferase involved in cell wall biosynthesis